MERPEVWKEGTAGDRSAVKLSLGQSGVHSVEALVYLSTISQATLSEVGGNFELIPEAGVQNGHRVKKWLLMKMD